ncbi:MAG TPA: response regulator [Solirubrobacteraceae bacterium]|nr:response regulator [Solirubrobacteraceae bacterium]
MPTVLVVDDDPDIRDIATMKLEQAGLEVVTEADGEGGLAAALELAPDALLLDWMMPRLTGIEVCSRLREHPQTARLPIILLTAKAQEADIERGFAAGATDYLVKPFSPRELVARITAVLARGTK